MLCGEARYVSSSAVNMCSQFTIINREYYAALLQDSINAENPDVSLEKILRYIYC